MTGRRALFLAIMAGCFYSTALGVLLGIVVDRIRFDAERAAVLSRLTTAERQVRVRLMDLERAPFQPRGAEPPRETDAAPVSLDGS